VRGLRHHFRVVALAAGRNATLLEEQAREFSPRLVCFEGNESTPEGVIPFGGAKWASLEEMAVHPEVDIVVVATSGKAGLFPTLAALRAGKGVALANKEALVMAGKPVMQAAAEGGGEIRPIDSEHSAIWQCLRGEKRPDVSRLILTASGGAFREKSLEELQLVTPEEALRHPTWRMGRKITIDSATLLNKGLETIEAQWLFGMPFEKIEVVMHRESIVHSLVEFADGSVKAQLGPPDMRLPIQYALSYPERLPLPSLPRLDLKQIGELHFEKVDLKRFPCLALALEAGQRGGTYPAVLTAADEVAVEHFLAGRIGFMDIAPVIEQALAEHEPVADPDLEETLSADAWARSRAEDLVGAKT
jgi:1-deoxy-D-xylulose-5-phosphate reductoisomerase